MVMKIGVESTGLILVVMNREILKDVEHEAMIIDSCLKGEVVPEKIRLFSKYTLNPENFREYKWTWCGRYSVPLALYTSYYLNE